MVAPNDVLDLVDQAVFLGEEATGTTSVIQTVWTYDHGVDMAGLRRFHHHLLRGRLSRRIERSPLPFGRHRWVAPAAGNDLEIDETPRPRAEFDQWLRDKATAPLDVQHGPGWRLAALPFTDGGTGLSLIISHTLTDGGGLCLALADAAAGHDDEIVWPAARSRRWRRAISTDARQFLRDVPSIRRAVVTATRVVSAGRRRPIPGPHKGLPLRTNPSPYPRRPLPSASTSGTPAPAPSEPPVIHCWSGSPPAWRSGWAGSPPTTPSV